MSQVYEASDDEIEALMAELEAQNAEIAAKNKPAEVPAPVVAAAPAPKIEPKVEPTPAPEPEQPKGWSSTTPDFVKKLMKNRVQPDPEPEQLEDVPDTFTSYAPVVVEEKPMPEPVLVAVPEPQPEPKPVPVVAAVPPVAPAPKPAATPKTASAASPLQFYVDVEQFQSDTRLTEATLDSCMIEQSGLRAFYGAQAANAEAQASRVKAKFEVLEAKMYDEHRKVLAASGDKVTEKMVENAVKMDPRWLKAKNMVIEADSIASINKGLVESIRDRKDMLIQLGADRREEFKGSLRIMEEKQGAENLRQRAIRAASASL